MASKYPHLEWLDLQHNGTKTECAVVKKDGLGNIYLIQLNHLDRIDKQRMAKILRSRQARQFPLWDLLSQITLGNGINALNYFHQYVRVLTPSGHIMQPQAGIMGVPLPPTQQAAAPKAV